MTMRREHAPILAGLLVPALLAVAAARPAFCQTSAARDDGSKKTEEHRIAVVTAKDVYVRSGGGDSYYPFGKMKRGDLVEVIGEKYGWAHVLTRGPAFDGFFGYIRTMPTQTVRFKVDATGTKGRTEGPVDLLAANLNSNYKPSDSWKRILPMPGGVELTVLETIETDEMTVHKVRLPENAKGWISARYLEPATAAQVAIWTEAIATRKRSGLGQEKPGQPADERTTAASAGTDEIAGATTDETTEEATGAERPGVLARNEETLPPAPVRPILTPPATGDPASARTTPPAEGRAAEVEMGAGTEGAAGTGTPARNAETDTARDAGADRDETLTDPAGAGAGAADVASGDEGEIAEGETAEIEMVAPPLVAIPEIRAALTSEEAEARYLALEEAHARLRKEPILTAEVVPLSHLYRQLAEASLENDVVTAYAAARTEQLVLWAELQERRAKIAELRKRLELSAEEADAVRLAIDAEGIYAAVGRLAGSTIFDGGRLPLLFRVHDARTGRTLGYLRPDRGFDLAGLVGQIVGVVGEKNRDPALRVTILEPRRIDLLVE